MYALIAMLAADNWSFLAHLPLALTVAVVTAAVTVWLAHRRFRADQCWLAKRDAYSGILKEMQRMANHFKMCALTCSAAAATPDGSVDPIPDAPSIGGCVRSMREQFAGLGFMLTPEAGVIFESLMSDVFDTMSDDESFSAEAFRRSAGEMVACQDKAFQTIKALHVIAKKDLRIK